MISIDYTLISTENVDIIKLCLLFSSKQFRRTKGNKNWKGYHIFTNDTGVKLYAHNNRFNEYDKLFIAFSPHKICNNNLHNANQIPFFKLLKTIIETLTLVGIQQKDYCYFKISVMEIGVNFQVYRDPYLFLNAALMFRNYFFQNSKYKHYKTAGSHKSKYMKIKFYIKAEQFVNNFGATFSNLGYCPENTMRFEIKIERTEKFTFFDFSNLQNLFRKDVQKKFQDFISNQFSNIFFFSPESVDEKLLRSTPEIRNHYQSTVKDYWKGLNATQRSQKKKYHEKLPKKYNLREEINGYFPLFEK